MEDETDGADDAVERISLLRATYPDVPLVVLRQLPSGFELLGTALVDPAVHPSLAAAFAAGALADMPGEPGEPGDVGRRQGEPHRPAVAAAPSTGGSGASNRSF